MIHSFSLPVLFTKSVPVRKHKRHALDDDVKKNVFPAEVIKNCFKCIFVGRCLVTRQFLILFTVLLTSSQELSFKCWENLVITPADC